MGQYPPRTLGLAPHSLDFNRDTIIGYWNGDILYTDEALAALKPLPPRG